MNNAVHFTDNGIKFVTLNRGHYLVDDKYIEVKEYSSDIQVKDFDNIKPITRTKVISYYTSDGEDRFEISEFKKQEEEFLQKRKSETDGYSTEYVWESLEDEFNYRKFKETWKPVFKDIEQIGDPYRFEIKESVADTGNPYIQNTFINGQDKDVTLFVYNRPQAVLNIVKECFTSLGMEFKGKASYNDTNKKKIWGNSEHSLIRYVTAFNTYIFGEQWEKIYSQLGDLPKLQSQYEKDKSALEGIIKRKYLEHFGEIEKDGFNFRELLSTLRTSLRQLNSVEYKQKSYQEYQQTRASLSKAISQIEESFKESLTMTENPD